jgi:malic enzyme
MILAAMNELASAAKPGGLSTKRILPPMSDRELPIRLAVAVGVEAQREGVAARQITEEAIRSQARQIIERARATLEVLGRERLFEPCTID